MLSFTIVKENNDNMKDSLVLETYGEYDDCFLFRKM